LEKRGKRLRPGKSTNGTWERKDKGRWKKPDTRSGELRKYGPLEENLVDTGRKKRGKGRGLKLAPRNRSRRFVLGSVLGTVSSSNGSHWG